MPARKPPAAFTTQRGSIPSRQALPERLDRGGVGQVDNVAACGDDVVAACVQRLDERGSERTARSAHERNISH